MKTVSLNENARVSFLVPFLLLLLQMLWPQLILAIEKEPLVKTPLEGVQYVKLSGDFKNTGFLRWHKGLTLGEAIEKAGGFTPKAYKIFLFHAKDTPTGDMFIRESVWVKEYKTSAIWKRLLLKPNANIRASHLMELIGQ